MTESTHRLLLVDDDPTCLALLCAYFESANYQVETARNGIEARERIYQHPADYFSAYVLDYHMPELDGISLLLELKHNHHYQMVPAIMQTSADSAEDIQRGIEAGAFYYLLKPFSKNHLLSLVETAVNGYATYQKLQRDSLRLAATFPQSLQLLERAKFRFRSLTEARQLSQMVSLLTPEPHKTAIGLFEIMVNAIEHGNLGIGYAEKTRLMASNTLQEEIERRQALPENLHKYADLEIQRHADRIDISIQDQGTGFDYQPYMEFSLERAMDSHGRGLMMANKLSFDRLLFLEGGSRVCCTIQL
ncbi:MAG: response regulator [Gammaproteobacteria bacterium]|nr:response regulator [Gammaproteobacteria bacterium]MBD3776952.1 response regulator [Thiotrichales bacterium]